MTRAELYAEVRAERFPLPPFGEAGKPARAQWAGYADGGPDTAEVCAERLRILARELDGEVRE